MIGVRDFEVVVPSKRPHLARLACSNIRGLEPRVVDGEGAVSFSWLVNQCVLSSPCEYVIIVADKVVPTMMEVYGLRAMLGLGWAVVAPYRFGFFGMSKEVMRRIGPMDEAFSGGGFEDNDFVLRLREADLAYYESEESAYTAMPTLWDTSGGPGHFLAKWGWDDEARVTVRLREEFPCEYDFGPPTDTEFLRWGVSMCVHHPDRTAAALLNKKAPEEMT